MTPEVFDCTDVAKMLRCAETTVEERARKGDIPGVKFGDGWIFPAQALFARLNELALEEAAKRRDPGRTKPIAIAQQPPGRGRSSRPLPNLPRLP